MQPAPARSPECVRIVAWNLGHRTWARDIEPAFFDTVERLRPDVLVLNEYVHGDGGRDLEARLDNLGLEARAVSRRIRNSNQILIAANTPIEEGDLQGPATTDIAPANYLHVRLPTIHLEVVGVRVPAYERDAETRAYWTELATQMSEVAARRLVYIGDMNADPRSTSSIGGKTLRALSEGTNGWTLPEASGDWSYISPARVGSRIDHALLAPALSCVGCWYLPEFDGIPLAAPGREAVSDHAPLVLDVRSG